MKRFKGKTSGCCWDMYGLNPCRMLRNIWSYFVLDNRWDQEDYPNEVGLGSVEMTTSTRHRHNNTTDNDPSGRGSLTQTKQPPQQSSAKGNGAAQTTKPHQQRSGVPSAPYKDVAYLPLQQSAV
eukprot:CAMPEP_0113848424 /NCGR_PEP_ID=MMETSP0372-20130328/2469_1 /TAXON_ID=340204 /ORGANISM="Lankesteria abbotti" /LENGTH=123 /DNA_ID=CAMNT_0000817905 /DNA_START=339 /DNA_END=710 /DNA_ORIENTATION=- /assembly_acc=CAM_ASM_000359